MTLIPSADDPLMSTGDLAACFGVNRKTIERWINANKLNAVKINKQWRVQRSEMIRFANEKYGDPNA